MLRGPKKTLQEELEAEAHKADAEARRLDAETRLNDSKNRTARIEYESKIAEQTAERERVHLEALKKDKAGQISFWTLVRRRRWIPLLIIAAVIWLWSSLGTNQAWMIITSIVLAGIVIFVTLQVFGWGVREVALEFLLTPLWWLEVMFFQPGLYGAAEQGWLRTICESIYYVPFAVLVSLIVGGKLYERVLGQDEVRRNRALLYTAWGPPIVSQAIFLLWLALFGKLLFGDQYLNAKYIWFVVVILIMVAWAGPEAWRTNRWETHVSRERSALGQNENKPEPGPPPDQTDPETAHDN